MRLTGWMRRKDARLSPQTPPNARADAGLPTALTCADVRAREWDFVEGMLPLPERLTMQAHLDGCEACRQMLSLCHTMDSALRSAPTHIPPAGDLRAGFYARLAAEQRPARRYGRPIALSALAAGVLVLALLRPTPQSSFSTHSGSSRPPVMVTRLSPSPTTSSVLSLQDRQGAEVTLTPHSVSGISETQADALFAMAEKKYIAPLKARPSSRHPVARRQDRHSVAVRYPIQNMPAMRNAEDAKSHFTSDKNELPGGVNRFIARETDGSVRARGSAFKLDMEAPGAPVSSTRHFDTREDKSGTTLLAAAIAPPPGASLAVVDEVRNFSNVTNIADKVTVESDGDAQTIYIESNQTATDSVSP